MNASDSDTTLSSSSSAPHPRKKVPRKAVEVVTSKSSPTRDVFGPSKGKAHSQRGKRNNKNLPPFLRSLISLPLVLSSVLTSHYCLLNYKVIHGLPDDVVILHIFRKIDPYTLVSHHLKSVCKSWRETVWESHSELNFATVTPPSSVLTSLPTALHLRKLALSYTQITDQGMETISGLTNLSWLDFVHCPLVTEQGVKYLSNLTNLTQLHCGLNNYITDHSFTLFCQKFSSLTLLDVSLNPSITEEGFCHVVYLTKLDTLNLFMCTGLTDASLHHLSLLTNLHSLDIGKLRIVNQLDHLSRLLQLTSLNLKYCEDLYDSYLENITSLKNLTYLILTGCIRVTLRGIYHLSALTKLETLSLQRCSLFSVPALTLPHLKTLGLGLTDINGISFLNLHQFTCLTTLSFYECSRIDDASLQFISQLVELEVLSLNKCESLTTRSIKVIATLPKLSRLVLKKTLFSSISELKRMTSLRILSLEECSRIKRYSSISSLTQLRELEIQQMPLQILPYVAMLTGMKSLFCGGSREHKKTVLDCLSSLTSLTTLDLSKCPKMQNKTLAFLSSLPSLTKLSVHMNVKLTNSLISILCDVPSLRFVDITGTKIKLRKICRKHGPLTFELWKMPKLM